MNDRSIRTALHQAGLDYLLELNERLPEQLETWLRMLAAAPRNLTAIREPAEALRKHAIEPLIGRHELIRADLAVPHGAMIDIGSGNGSPGLPIALCEPARAAVLLDSRAGAAAFLERVGEALGVERISVRRERAEAAAHGALREQFALALSRAAAPPAAALELALPLLAVGGVAALWTGPLAADELERCERTAAALGALLTPIDAASPVDLVTATKQRPSDSRYPRPWNQIRRGPPTALSLCSDV